MGYIATLAISYIAALIGAFINHERVVVISYAIIIPILVSLPRLLGRISVKARLRLTPAWHGMADGCIFVLVLLNAPGSLVLHAMGVQYDRFLHFGAPLVGFFLSVLVVAAWRPDLGKTAVLKRAMACVLISIFAWEAFQASTDAVFQTHLFFDKKQSIQVDVSEDVLFGMLGGLVAVVLFSWTDFFWRRTHAASRPAAVLNEQRT